MKATLYRILPPALYNQMAEIYYRLRGAVYAGNGVYCPSCRRSYRRFIPGGYQRRPYARCPGCNALERHRLMCLYLEDKLQALPKPSKLLHIAPEPAIARLVRNRPGIDYISADLERPAMEKMDITDIHKPANTFDVILCSHVLEHVPDDRKAMAELCRVLKPTGWAILQVPMDPQRPETLEDPDITTDEQRRAVYGHHDHKRLYGADYADRLRAAGFEVTIDHFSQQLEPEKARQYGVPRNENIYLCRKAAPASV